MILKRPIKACTELGSMRCTVGSTVVCICGHTVIVTKRIADKFNVEESRDDVRIDPGMIAMIVGIIHDKDDLVIFMLLEDNTLSIDRFSFWTSSLKLSKYWKNLTPASVAHGKSP